MTILYLFITGLPLTMMILKIKNKEFEDPISPLGEKLFNIKINNDPW
jgi:hypothetical protein|tara:strand:+ start:278 stop:418 length:141 start_codon:yes stop_codon:yes gene_type:complete